MAILFPRYELKIFSFRQKDYNGNRWAGEFFRDLKTGIESAFNDKLSICISLTENPEFTTFSPKEVIS